MRISVNGITLHAALAGAGPPLLLLHGFTGSAATWRPLAERLAPLRRTIAVDLIGHGLSDAPADPARYSMEHCLADLLALLDALGLARAAVLGYSLGGRVALQLVAAAPERVSALVLESASPGLASAAERAARAAADDALSTAIERDGLAAFVAGWEQLPLWASQAALPAELRAAPGQPPAWPGQQPAWHGHRSPGVAMGSPARAGHAHAAAGRRARRKIHGNRAGHGRRAAVRPAGDHSARRARHPS
jgi:pimeloyl-ACP methyl ester carboxylesterase